MFSVTLLLRVTSVPQFSAGLPRRWAATLPLTVFTAPHISYQFHEKSFITKVWTGSHNHKTTTGFQQTN